MRNKNRLLLFNVIVIALFTLNSFTTFAQSGESCDDPYSIELEESQEFNFQKNQTKSYLSFTATDSIYAYTITPNGSDPFPSIFSVELYLNQGCEELSLVQYELIQDSLDLEYLHFNHLSISADYLVIITRDPNSTYSVSSFLSYLTAFASCTSAVTTCDEIIKNGDFSSTSIANPDPLHAFEKNQICDWKGLFRSPSYIYLDANSSPIDPRCGIWVQRQGTAPNYNIYGEAVVQEIPTMQSGAKYILKVKVKRRTGWEEPSELRFAFVNYTNILYNQPFTYDKLANNFTGMKVESSLSSPFSLTNYVEYTICVQPNMSGLNRLIIYPYETSFPNSHIAQLEFDDISLKKLVLDAGPDVYAASCEAQPIGPDPNCLFAGATYSWSPTTGLDNPNIANPKAMVSSSTTYTLTLSYPGGCSITDQVIVSPNAQYTLTNTNVTTMLGNVPYTNGTLNPTITGFTLYIDGTFTVNQNVTFRDCHIIMGENAKINVISGELKIDGSDPTRSIKSCDPDKFWDGIYVNPNNVSTAKLSIKQFPGTATEKLQFSNSYNGIVVNYDTEILINYVNFDRNNRVFLAENILSATKQIQIANSTFNCSQPLKTTSIPFIDYYPSTAVKIRNVDYTVSMKGVASWWNHFKGTGGNLQIDNSDFISDFDVFQDYSNYPFYNPSLLKTEKAIEIIGSNAVSDRVITILRSKFLSNLTSIDIQGSIEVRVTKAIVNFDDVTNTAKPIIPNSRFFKVFNNKNEIYVASYSGAQVDRNKIYNVQTGFQINDCERIIIGDVDMDLEYQGYGVSNYTSKTNTNSVGISYDNLGLLNNTTLHSEIHNNTIKHAKLGILVYNSQIKIEENDILDLNDVTGFPNNCNPCYNNPSWGIKTINSESSVIENKVYNDLTNYINSNPSTNTKVIGIEIQLPLPGPSGAPDTKCNNVENTGVGLRFNAYEQNGLNTVNNSMKNHVYGFVIDNNTEMGGIGSLAVASINQWNGNYSGSRTLSKNSDGSLSTLFVQNSTGGIYDPMIALGHIQGSAATAISFNNNSTVGNVGCTTRARIRNNTTTNAGFTAFTKSTGLTKKQPHMVFAVDSAIQFHQQMLFYNLSKDSALMNSTTWKQFSDSMRTTPMGKMVGKPLNTAGRGAITVGTPTNFDANLVLMNPIADHFKNRVPLTKLEMSQLQAMAHKCPFYDGIAVYQARFIITSLGGNEVFNDCEMIDYVPASTIGGSSKRLKDENAQQSPFAIYPNPSKEIIFLNFEVSDQENVTFELYDVLGKQQLIKRLNATNTHQVKINAVQPGIYFYRIVSNDAAIESGKLIIE